jgi:hypothetical protein
MTIWRMCIACWIPKATNTHSQYVILIAFALQQPLHERATRYYVIRTLPVLLFVIFHEKCNAQTKVVLQRKFSLLSLTGIVYIKIQFVPHSTQCARLRLKRDGTRAETRFRPSPTRTSPFKSAGASVQSTTGSRGVRISVSNAGYTVFRGSVKSIGYPLHSPVSPSLPLPCATVCHHISTGIYR